MITDYAYVGLFLVFGIVFVASAFIVSWLLRPRVSNPLKNAPYECGEIVLSACLVFLRLRKQGTS